MKILGFFNHVHDYDVVSSETETIPDQSLSVREILTRYTRDGMSLPLSPWPDESDIDSAGHDDFDDIVDASASLARGNALVDDVRRTKETEHSSESGDQPPSESVTA